MLVHLEVCVCIARGESLGSFYFDSFNYMRVHTLDVRAYWRVRIWCMCILCMCMYIDMCAHMPIWLADGQSSCYSNFSLCTSLSPLAAPPELCCFILWLLHLQNRAVSSTNWPHLQVLHEVAYVPVRGRIRPNRSPHPTIWNIYNCLGVCYLEYI